MWCLMIPNGKSEDDEMINLNLEKSKSLLCYQCKSSSKEPVPLCDISYFKLTRPKEKLNLTYQCPPHRKSFCFTNVIYKEKEVLTQRGCYGDKDKKNNTIKNGCMISQIENKVLCFCNRNICNKVSPISTSWLFVNLVTCVTIIVTHVCL